MHLIRLFSLLLLTLTELQAESLVSLSPSGDINTPLAARDQARSLPKPVRIVVAHGEYPLGEGLDLGPEDSQVTWEAAPEATPVFSGGRRLPAWQHQGNGQWKITLPEVADGSWYFEQLWINGRRATRARTPNRGFLHMKHKGNAAVFPPEGDPAKWDQKLHYHGFRTDAAGYSPFLHMTASERPDVLVTIPHTWDVHHYRINRTNDPDQAVLLNGPAARPLLVREPDGRFFVENYRAALDEPGEWFLSRTGELWYQALPDEDMASAVTIAPLSTWFIKGKNVSSLTFRCIAFRYQQGLIGDQGYGSNQAAQTMGAAVEFDHSSHITFDQCEIAHTHGYGMWFHQDCHHSNLVHSHLHDLGAGGVRAGATSQGAEQPSSHLVIDNNIIQHGGRRFPDAVGVLVGHASDVAVTHNDIGDFYYTGVSVGWHWGYGETVSHRNRIENNHIHHIGWGITSDMGGFYGLGTAWGSVVRGNHIHHISSYGYGGWGLYTDEGSSGLLMENNLVHDTRESGFHQHYGYYNIIRNNIFAYGAQSQIRRSRAEPRLSFVIERNVFVWDPATSALLYGDRSHWTFPETHGQGNPARTYVMKRNLYAPQGGVINELLAKTWTWEAWQQSGRDTGSIVAKPEDIFVDPAQRDFRLKEGNPTSHIGFQPWDLDLAGVRRDSPRGSHWRDKALEGAHFPNWETDSQPWPVPRYRLDQATFRYQSAGSPPTLSYQSLNDEHRGTSILVTNETHSPFPVRSGERPDDKGHSLKLQDADDFQHAYNPHYFIQPPHFDSGTILWSFDLLATEHSPWFAELRSPMNDGQYLVGPRITARHGKLYAGSHPEQELATLSEGQWIRVETRAQLGTGKWELTLRLDGVDEPITGTFDTHPDWKHAATAIWSSLGTSQQNALFLDNLTLLNE